MLMRIKPGIKYLETQLIKFQIYFFTVLLTVYA
jgi:hypothetical protein